MTLSWWSKNRWNSLFYFRRFLEACASFKKLVGVDTKCSGRLVWRYSFFCFSFNPLFWLCNSPISRNRCFESFYYCITCSEYLLIWAVTFPCIYCTEPSMRHEPVLVRFLFLSFDENRSKSFSKLLFSYNVLYLFFQPSESVFPCFVFGWVSVGCQRFPPRKIFNYQGSTGFVRTCFCIIKRKNSRVLYT